MIVVAETSMTVAETGTGTAAESSAEQTGRQYRPENALSDHAAI